MTFLQTSLLTAALCTFAAGGTALAQSAAPQATSYEPTLGQPGKDVMWLPTSQALIDRMLDMAELTPQDKLVDLGSGDGRTVITAAKRGATAHGIEFNRKLVEHSKRAALEEGVADRATFEQADIFESDFSKATVVTLFLLPELNLQLRPTLLDMKPGTRVVSNSFMMEDWQPDESAHVTEGCTQYCNAYKWIVPAKVAGEWQLGDKDLVLKQSFQMLDGTLGHGKDTVPVTDARLEGARIMFSVGGQRYVGEVSGNRMKGKADDQRDWSAVRKP